MSGDDPGFPLPGGDQSRTVRANEPRFAGAHDGEGAHHVECRDALGDAHHQRDAGVCRFHDRVGGKRRRHENHGRIRTGLAHRIGDRVEHRPAFVCRATLARCHAADDLRPVRRRLLCVEGALLARESLDDQTRVPIDQYGHDYFASATTRSAASLIVSAVVKFRRLSRSICFPFSTLVPSILMTIGTGTPRSFTAAMTPSARMSHRRMPPKILMSTALTCVSDIRMRNAFLICSAFAPPPTSRKLAGSPPASLMMSIVAIARPAPLTMHPIVP